MIFWTSVGYDFSLFAMKLEYDGEYRARLVGKCRTIRDRDDLQLLCRTTDLMICLDVSLICSKQKCRVLI
jgi:hypothetical protein